jgi:hypothetical protein
MRIVDFDIQPLVDALLGTCDRIEDHLPEGMDWDDLTSSDHDAIDNQIFRCETCGWWCESSEEDDNGDCEDCKYDNTEETDNDD